MGGGSGGEVRGGEGSGWGGQGGCESRIEVFWKIQKKKIGEGRVGPWGGGGPGGGGGGVGLGGQDGCERRIEVFVKIKKKKNLGGGGSRGGGGGGGGVGGEGSGWGVRVDVNEELKFL